MKLFALAKSGGCSLEHGLREAWHTLSMKKKVNCRNWKQPDPAQNTLPIRRKRFLNTGITSCWCTETVSLFELQIIDKHFTHRLIEFRFYIVLWFNSALAANHVMIWKFIHFLVLKVHNFTVYNSEPNHPCPNYWRDESQGELKASKFT